MSTNPEALPPSVPAEFPEILRDLNREILKAQPENIISFCADYFNRKGSLSCLSS
jgi:hypothetical protein